jgi:hypothetical protein
MLRQATHSSGWSYGPLEIPAGHYPIQVASQGHMYYYFSPPFVRSVPVIYVSLFILSSYLGLRKTSLNTKNAVFMAIAPSRYCVNLRFGGKYRLHLQGRKIHERGASVSRWLQTVCV